MSEKTHEDVKDALVPNVIAANDRHRQHGHQGKHVSDREASEISVGRFFQTPLQENAQIEDIADDAEQADAENNIPVAEHFNVV